MNDLPPHPTKDDWSTRDIIIAVLFALAGLTLVALAVFGSAIVNWRLNDMMPR
ncbi:hypothetical protein ETAA8_25920 [Anatilimnocola aggregata]|uniref:Uncharacterized protein n=1 Tax=Anatilimnocola aggregata TaxID=2528021 RepID=A0A517YBA8_9BACT|nr:hypothetical protein [Anatilimnocola aggregata]QDU27504.1 hypothetical protein ETAA8_25920 [Anatilimnocola aggregata]